MQAGAGGDGGDGGEGFEGQEQGVEWSRRGRNSAVGCISVSRSDGWVVALFVLCCHTALAPAWALMRGGPDRRAGTRRASGAGDLSRGRLAQARRHMKTEGRGEAAKLTAGQASTWAPACGTYQHIKITRRLTRLNANSLQPRLVRQNLPDICSTLQKLRPFFFF